MFLKKKKLSQLFSVALLTFLLSGCNSNEKSMNYYLSLMGESQSWNLTGYEVVITTENFKAGNGTLTMKNENEYIADSFRFETYAVINGENVIVHASSVTGEGIDIAEQTTGSIEGEAYFNKNRDPISLNEVSEIYMIVEWWEKGKSESRKERIDLFNKVSKENTFLNG